MKVLVSGASGLVGSALAPALARSGHEVVRLVRRPPDGPGEVGWDPAGGRLSRGDLAGVDAAVHLAGEPLAERWTPERRARIRDSRVGGTRLLAETLALLEPPPRVLVSGSAMGWYGDRGDEVLGEDAAPGEGFLAEVAREWGGAADPARAAGIRVAHPRTAIVLSPRGGALRRMIPPFRAGLGGPLGSGSQWWSWITLGDLVAALRFALERDELSGPFNAAAPGPVRQRDFAVALARALDRPAFVPTPAWALRMLFGGMADEALLASQRLAPARLAACGFVFENPLLEPALRRVLESDAPA